MDLQEISRIQLNIWPDLLIDEIEWIWYVYIRANKGSFWAICGWIALICSMLLQVMGEGEEKEVEEGFHQTKYPNI